MKKYVMALDQGTTSSRCILFDHEGTICSMTQKEFTQIYPQPGWVEHDPLEIWSSQLAVCVEALSKIGAGVDDIAAIGITNQRETTIVWDRKTGKPIFNAIVWQCRRTAERIEEIVKEGWENKIREKTGLIPDAYFSASKIEWILNKVPGARERAEKGELCFGTVDTWLIYNLTKGKTYVTDYTNASRTMLFNIHTLSWDDEILELFGIPKQMLPEVKPSSQIYGYTDSSVTGGNIPIAGAAGDQQAALFGQCCFEKGEVKNTYGTGCFLLMNTGHDIVSSKNGLLTTIAAGLDDKPQYALEGSVFVAGAAVQWLRDELQIIGSAPETEEMAQSVPDSAGVYIVPAFTGLGAPYWNPHARGMITGLTRGATKKHLVRATLESLAYQTRDVLRAMEKDSGSIITKLLVDGGASANNFLMQFQADILASDVMRPLCIETTAMGAAFLAGIATGFWKDMQDVKKIRSISKTFSPVMDESDRVKRLKEWKRAVKCAIAYTDAN
ncbi:MAG: glycerol kinase GlpK [Lachnospiraceae bacterium]|nr:glycerol kinase GlpK [Candidatus Merdinaster equi]